MDVLVSGSTLRVKRELEGGWFQWLSIPLPALLTIQSGINQLRYATLKGIMAAKKKEIKEVSAPAEIVERPSHQKIEKVYLPQKMKQTQMLGNGDAKAGAAQRVQGFKGVRTRTHTAPDIVHPDRSGGADRRVGSGDSQALTEMVEARLHGGIDAREALARALIPDVDERRGFHSRRRGHLPEHSAPRRRWISRERVIVDEGSEEVEHDGLKQYPEESPT